MKKIFNEMIMHKLTALFFSSTFALAPASMDFAADVIPMSTMYNLDIQAKGSLLKGPNLTENQSLQIRDTLKELHRKLGTEGVKEDRHALHKPACVLPFR